MLKLNLQENSAEPRIFKEIFCDQVYDMDYNKEDIVLNIGGHIGLYDMMYHKKVKEIHSYEPSKNNYARLEEHITINNIKNSTTFQKGIAKESGYHILTHLDSSNSGMNSICEGSGETEGIYTVTFWEAYNRPFTKIKCDCEGAEYEIFEGLVIPQPVKQMVFELHTWNQEYKQRADNLIKEIEAQGFISRIVHTDGDSSFNILFSR